MNKNEFVALLDIIRKARSMDDEPHKIGLEIGLEDHDLELFYVELNKIDCQEGFAIMPLAAYDLWTPRELFYLPYSSIIGIIEHRFEEGDSSFDLVLQEEILVPIRKLISRVMKAENIKSKGKRVIKAENAKSKGKRSL